MASRSSTSDDFAKVTNLSPKINSPRSEFGPFLSSDGLTLMFSSVSRGGRNQHDLYFATRPSTDAPFEQAVAIRGAINTVCNEYGPCLAESGTVLYFYSNRPGGLGHADIWVSRRVPKNALPLVP
jgi:Tol biopolymer transport system component